MTRLADVAPAVVTAVATAGAYAALRRRPPGGSARWERRSHSGRTVTLLEGPALVVGASVGAMAAGSPAGAVAVLGAGALGALDDHVGATDVKGLRGHLGALRQGHVTTGALKIVGIAATGVATAVLTDRRAAPLRVTATRCTSASASTLVGAVVVAGAANVANLLDLRPGRALKACCAVVAPLAARESLAGVVLASSAVLLPDDLGRRAMLGDTGANAAGALVGAALLPHLGLHGRCAAGAVVVALVLASEKVSFTKVIERTPVLRELDALGRAPA